MMVEYLDDLYTRQINVVYNEIDPDNARRSVSYTRVLRVNWICYGPSSFDDADVIRIGLLSPWMTEQLAGANMALITDLGMPTRSPELFGGQWWERTSFYARFNEQVTRQADVPYLQSADVNIIKG
nr:hypothetical protein [Paenibacillus ginsengarvi]